jgi:hypothetical protein
MPSASTPRELLSATRTLTRRVRVAQRGAWFPLLLFGVATFGAVPIDRYWHRNLTCTVVHRTGYICTVYSNSSFVYWPIVLVLCYAAITAFYVNRAQERGVGTPIKPYVIAGIVLAVVLTAASVWTAHNPPSPRGEFFAIPIGPGTHLGAVLYRLDSPACAIGLALLVLARVERNWALLVFTIGYLSIVLLSVNFGWVLRHPSPWSPLPHLVIAGALLLLGAAFFSVAERRTQ